MQKSIVIVCIAVIFVVMTTGCSNSASETPSVLTQQQAPVGSETPQTQIPNDVEDPQNNSPSDSPSVSSEATVPFDPSEYLTDDEFVFAKGVHLEMSYEEVLSI